MLDLLILSLSEGIGLAMDAFSVSLANGLADPKMKLKKAALIALIFALFQGVMPMTGWFFVHSFVEAFKIFEPFIPYIALGLLSFIGGKMLWEGLHPCAEGDTCCLEKKKLGLKTLLVQGVATSIDALSVGFTTSKYNASEALLSALIIAAITFVICLCGVLIGNKFGTKLSNKAAILGGVILIAIGLEIFITSFFK
ncbi:MAG: manganese efflux pump [Ruminococcaceae bacterium]|nr:manganese efflux pump [Oscillospiraceae bacterium]